MSTTAVSNGSPPQASKPVILDDGMTIDSAAGHARSGRVPKEAFVEWLAGRDVPADRLAVLLANGLLAPADFAFILEARDRRAERKGAARAKCSMTKEQFLAHAESFKLTVGDKALECKPREFSTGSFGWFLSGKANIAVGETTVPVQIGVNIAVIGSKPAKPVE